MCFGCSKFQLLIKTKMLKNKDFCLAFKLSVVVFIVLINVKMPTIVGILTFISTIKFILSCMKKFYNLEAITFSDGSAVAQW